MTAVLFGVMILGALIAYESWLGLKSASAAPSGGSGPASAGSSPGTVPTVSLPPGGGSVPQSWLIGLARNESPSALQGNFQYGAFGLSAGSTPGYGTPGTSSYGSLDPRGGSFQPQIFSSWAEAVSGLTAWINRKAPQAWSYAATGN